MVGAASIAAGDPDDGRQPRPVRAGQPGEVGVPLLAVGVQGGHQGPLGVDPLGLRERFARQRQVVHPEPAGAQELEPEPGPGQAGGGDLRGPDRHRRPLVLDRQLGAADERLAGRLPLDPDPDLGVGLVRAEPRLDRQRGLDVGDEPVADDGCRRGLGVEPEAAASRVEPRRVDLGGVGRIAHDLPAERGGRRRRPSPGAGHG